MPPVIEFASVTITYPGAEQPALANVDLDAANLTELEKKSSIVQRLVFSGFDPASILAALDLPAGRVLRGVAHRTGDRR